MPRNARDANDEIRGKINKKKFLDGVNEVVRIGINNARFKIVQDVQQEISSARL